MTQSEKIFEIIENTSSLERLEIYRGEDGSVLIEKFTFNKRDPIQKFELDKD